ncbi:glycosyltransferase family 39 protein [Ramlibacter solisilvae]|uniref:Glycosyltransferase RgtA/B/C/D-like domain-containing protein n=1 Tax=Ramlibacter tataouinensis TaxID=94132 RepID=A0A127JPD6_9BURK|nr:glycosyltransferase family 39 protein [Ramlibacter tataouinensis]AMO21753.1 hypothetical protein UC35_01280 [Ramlibacter tataouinensis]
MHDVKRALLRSFWTPLALAALWLTATIGARPLALPDEGRYVGVAWQMLTSGDWLTPRLDGLPYFHKPPLFFWITAASLGMFGQHEWAARLAPLLGAFLGLGSIYLFASRWFSRRAGRLALLALATQPLFFVGAQFANLDMLVAGCITAAIAALAHAALLRPHGRRSHAALAAGYLFMGLGVLSKGLIGIVLPGLVLVSWLMLRGQWRPLLSLIWLPGIALFLLVVAPWFVLVQQRFPEFSHYFFVVQHFARYATGGFNNRLPAYFYPVVLILFALPWTAWMFVGARAGAWRDPERGAVRQLAWIWMLAIVAFFSLPESKLVGYILPAAAPAALLAADGFELLAARWARAALWWRGGAAAAVLACLAAVIAATALPRNSTRELGLALRRELAPVDRVMFLQAYYFDLPFYASMHSPAAVVDAWDSKEIGTRDNWRKELFDAARFQPALGRQLLLRPQDLQAGGCGGAVTWVVGSEGLQQHYPLLQGAEEVARQRDLRLWRVSAARSGISPPDCPGMPIANSADKS